MTRALATLAFLGSAVLMPWFVTVPLGVLMLSAWRERALLFVGGILMDTLFGVPVPMFGGFMYFYTALFTLLIVVEFFLREQLID